MYMLTLPQRLKTEKDLVKPMSTTIATENLVVENTAPIEHSPSDAVHRLGKFEQSIVSDQEVTYSFKGYTQKDENGNPVLDEKGKPVKVPARPPFKIYLPVPTEEGLVQALADDKQRAYIMNLLKDDIVKAAKIQVDGTDEVPGIKVQSELDPTKLTLEFLANQPVSDRRGAGISSETWDDFFSDYVDIMPAATNRPVEKVRNAGKMFLNRLQNVKGDKESLKFLEVELHTWARTTKRMQEFGEIYEFLQEKAKTFLNMSPEASLSRLQ